MLQPTHERGVRGLTVAVAFINYMINSLGEVKIRRLRGKKAPSLQRRIIDLPWEDAELSFGYVPNNARVRPLDGARKQNTFG